MANCEHCGTAFSPTQSESRYCCKGCEYVAELIAEQGFEQFYDLKQGLALAPVRSRPFEDHDFSWLDAKVSEAEAQALKTGKLAHLDFGIEGISCVGCVWLIEKLFDRHDGGVRAVAHPSSARLHLEWSPGQCDIRGFLNELCQFGYVAAPVSSLKSDSERRRLAARLGLCGAFALNTMGFSLPIYLGMPADFEFAGLFRMIAFFSASLSMLVGGGYFIDRAWRSVRVGALHIDLPIALGLLSAYVGSIVGWAVGHEELMYFDFVSIFVFLMLGGRWLQSSAVEKNRKRLVRQQPVPEVLPLADSEKTIHREEVRPGSKFILQPGQALPVSAVLADGNADFSLEWIHGEADPVGFSAGSRLPSGAILLSRAPAVLVASEVWEESLLSKLIAGGGVDRGSPTLERVLRWYLATVLVLGVATFAMWGLLGDWLTAMQAMISVFVVSCPCALGVAIPLADDLATSAVERLGVFVRSPSLWSRLMGVKRLIFDKTGTLTLERPILEDADSVVNLDDDAALALARLTHRSLHPVSRSLLESLSSRGQRLLAKEGVGTSDEFPGLGVRCGDWSLGKAGWTGGSDEVVMSGGSATELRHHGEVRASFRFSESLRPGAVEALSQLREMGMSLEILSGDHPDKVSKLADAMGIPQSSALGALSPEDKARRVREIDAQDTLYLGDGANDSLAFDAAWVTGTPVVDRSLLEAKADFFSLQSGMSFLLGLFSVANARAMAVRAVFFFAAVYNVAAVAISMAGWMSPLIAAILMPTSSILSILIVLHYSRRKSSIKG